MSDLVLAILRSAVTLAKTHQIRDIPTLKQRLLEHYPGEDAAVQKALSEWARMA